MMAIHPSLGDCIYRVDFPKTEQPADYSSKSDLDKDNRVEPERIQRIRALDSPLDLMSLHKCNKDCMNRQNGRRIENS